MLNEIEPQMSMERLDDFLLAAQKLKVKGLLTETQQMFKDNDVLQPSPG